MQKPEEVLPLVYNKSLLIFKKNVVLAFNSAVFGVLYDFGCKALEAKQVAALCLKMQPKSRITALNLSILVWKDFLL